MNYKKYSIEPIYFGLDFLEFTIKGFSELKFFEKYNISFDLDFDNSSQGFIYVEEIQKKLSYRKVNFKNYNGGLIFTISIDDVAFDIMYCAIGTKNKAGIVTKSKVGFYSTFFVLQNIGKLNFRILDFYNSLFKDFDNRLHRLDICLDLSSKIEDLGKTLFIGVNFYSSLGKDKKNDMFAETYYLKNPLSSKNRFYIFRVYDKILDTFKKGKNFLFIYLEDYQDVRRVELEMRGDSCAMVIDSIEDILGNKNYIQERIFKNYLVKEGNFNKDFLNSVGWFNDIGQLSLLSNVKTRIDLKEVYGDLGHIPKNYISMGHGYIKKIYEVAGIDGVFDLIFKSYTELNQKNITERSDFIYKFFEDFMKYLSKNSTKVNKFEINRTFKSYYVNFKNLKIGKKIKK